MIDKDRVVRNISKVTMFSFSEISRYIDSILKIDDRFKEKDILEIIDKLTYSNDIGMVICESVIKSIELFGNHEYKGRDFPYFFKSKKTLGEVKS